MSHQSSHPKTSGKLCLRWIATIAFALICTSQTLWAQERENISKTDGTSRLNFELTPNFGDILLGGDFGAEPFIIEITAGGDVDASYLGDDCVGFMTEAPDFRLFWEGDASILVLSFEPINQGDDPTMVINTPDGTWLCNDDASDESLSPLLLISEPQHGQYDIWIGSFEEGEYIEGILYIIDLVAFSATLGDEDTETSQNLSLDFALEPFYGSENLEEGFVNDPFEISVVSGGSVSVEMLSLGFACVGYASQAPDFRLNWTGSTHDLKITFVPGTPGDDTALIVNTSEGGWICNDDAHSETVNPEIILRGMPEGQFDIWIASYNEGEFHEGTLIITEL